MMNHNLAIVFSALFLAGFLTPAYAQIADHVVINEVDTNPLGDDSASIIEWVELYNPTDSDVDIGGWKIASTSVLKKTMIIQSDTVIESGEFLTFSYKQLWFADANESVELLDAENLLVDKTPSISDFKNDFTSWQRLYDGYGSGGDDDWKFAQPTAGSSNGKLVQSQVSAELAVTVSTSKPSYVFGETAVIQGSISKEIVAVKPYFLPQRIMVDISGPGFETSVPLYPDLNLNYKTTLNLQKVLGINEGSYDVTANYGDATADASFAVGYEIVEQETKKDGELSILTDKSQYLPGQLVLITGFITDVVPLEGLKFTVTDPNGILVENGNLFPTGGEFTTSVFVDNVEPVYGTYDVDAKYSDKSASASFKVVDDVKEDVPISLWTDKDVYGLGESVTITGRVNDVWIGSFDLEIYQIPDLIASNGNAGFNFKILDVLRVDGMGFFEYSFVIPDEDSRLGDYFITVSKDIGDAKTSVKVVKNPDAYVLSDAPLSITTSKPDYDLNIDRNLIISGQISNLAPRSSLETPVVKITIDAKDEDSGSSRLPNNVLTDYAISVIPDLSGTFSSSVNLDRLIFPAGTYVITARYLDDSATVEFNIIDQLRLGDSTIYATLDKSVYGLGETVYLTGTHGVQTNTQGMTISVYTSSGDVYQSGTVIDAGYFSWEWTTPISERHLVVGNERTQHVSNYGVYKIELEIGSDRSELFFKVSTNPETDELVVPVLSVSTSKPLYKAGEKLIVAGTVSKVAYGNQNSIIPERVSVQIFDGIFPYRQILESFVYPDQGGSFETDFELPVTVFSEGQYTVKATYDRETIEHKFAVANEYVFGLDEPIELLVSTDKSEYSLGDVVTVTGKPNKLIYLEGFDVSVGPKSGDDITCGTFICGNHDNSPTFIRPSPSGSFTHQFAIPDMPSAVGTYQVNVDADFATKSVEFTVYDTSDSVKPASIIDKVNRISESEISITTEEKTVDDSIVAPRALSGSLLTPDREDESRVNLKVLSSSGVCIIGPDDDCLVKESTRKRGQIYDVVEVDGISLNIRYSGPDVRLEKFSILPESLEFLPGTSWDVKVLKDDQASRFYYKIVYKAVE